MNKLYIFLFSFLFLLGLAVSCQKNIKQNEINRVESLIISNESPVYLKDNQPKQKEMKVKPAKELEITDFNKKYKISAGNENGKEVISFDGTKLVNINPDQKLIKDERKIESYLLKVKRFDADYQNYLVKKGVIFGYYIPDNTVIVRLSNTGQIIKNLEGFVSDVPYQPFMKISKSDGDIENIKKAKVSLWDINDTNWFYSFCAGNHIKITGNTGKEFIVDSANVKAILFEEKVLRVEKYRDLSVFSVDPGTIGKVVAFGGVNANILQSCPANVSVYDVGIDDKHADLSGVLANIYETAGDNDTGEFVPHGTHVAGIIAGRGNNSGGQISGINPEAKIQFFAMGDSLTGLTIPPSMRNLFNLSILNNSYIANLSWGTYDDNLAGTYLSISRDIDQFVYDHPEMIIIAAVGNNGNSIASPATAKNVISVGALDGNDTALYSGRGPCYDGRFKPEISVQGSGVNSLGLNNSYAVLSGTSQAAAVVSGLVSRLTGVIKNIFNLTPTHSIVKSLLIANTMEDNPSLQSGYGRLMLNSPIDTNHITIKHFTDSDEFRNIDFTVKQNDKITIVLSWTDPPAFESSLMNLIDDFDLEVAAPSGKIISSGDYINNVEKVVLPATEEGNYRVRIISKFVPLKVNDISLIIKSQLGFQTAQSVSQNFNLSNTDEKPVDSSQSGQSQFSASGSGVNQGISAGQQQQTVNVTAGSTINSPSVPAVPAVNNSVPASVASQTAEEPADNLLSQLSSNNTNTVTTPVIYGRPGSNIYSIRALGIDGSRYVGVNLSGTGINAGETLIPVEDSTNIMSDNYRQFQMNLEDSQDIINGDLSVKSMNGDETNHVPVEIMLDKTAPAFGDCYPTNNGTLTDSTAWIDIQDDKSGVDTNFVISVNGVIITNGEAEYNFGNNRLSIDFSRIYPPKIKRDVLVKFLKVADMVGNIADQTNWVFKYDNSNDTTPPDKPSGLAVDITNKIIRVSWDTNTDKDLAGYYLYQISQDFSAKVLLTNGLILTNVYTFTSKNLSKIGLTAVDTSSNESVPAILNVNYQAQNYPPEITIQGIPERTNGTVTGIIFLKDDGWLVSTNTSLSAVSISTNTFLSNSMNTNFTKLPLEIFMGQQRRGIFNFKHRLLYSGSQRYG